MLSQFFQRQAPAPFETPAGVKRRVASPTPKKEGLTLRDVAQHNTRDDCWMVIDGKAYDVTSWIDKHPGGDVMLSYAGMDATDVFNVFHEDASRKMLSVFFVGDVVDVKVSKSLQDYRDLGKKLREDQFFQSNKLFYLYKIATNLGLATISALLVFNFPDKWIHFVAAILLALFWQQCGWLSHDFLHHQVFKNRKYNNYAGYLFGNVCQGFSVGWWKAKHNLHHAVPNVAGYDPDIDTLPFLAWSEKLIEGELTGLPHFLIKYQYLFYFPLLMAARLSWLIQSIIYANSKSRARGIELTTLAIHWILLCTLAFCNPYMSVLGGIGFILTAEFATGLLLATAFSLNHNGMAILEKGSQDKMDFHALQAITGRDVHEGPLSFVSWFMGGLDYQIEHHLFPQIPRHKLKQLSAKVGPLCQEHKILYHKTDFFAGTKELFGALFRVSGKVH